MSNDVTEDKTSIRAHRMSTLLVLPGGHRTRRATVAPDPIAVLVRRADRTPHLPPPNA